VFVVGETLQGDEDADWQNHLDYPSTTGRWCEIRPSLLKEYTWNESTFELERCNKEEEEREGFSAIVGPMVAELKEDSPPFGEFEIYRTRVVVR